MVAYISQIISKLFRGGTRDRQILLSTAGNLATSQAVGKILSEQIKDKKVAVNQS